MHELSLAHEVIQILSDEAGQHGVSRIVRFSLEVGQLRGVVPELMRTCLEIASRGTAAEGALIELGEIAGRARCTSCGHEFAIADVLILCPACDHAGGEIVSGDELRVLELEGE
jgi:hydrogenase nickel incorporation protein HypA/HybF